MRLLVFALALLVMGEVVAQAPFPQCPPSGCTKGGH
jgi:hypothetical protein